MPCCPSVDGPHNFRGIDIQVHLGRPLRRLFSSEVYERKMILLTIWNNICVHAFWILHKWKMQMISLRLKVLELISIGNDDFMQVNLQPQPSDIEKNLMKPIQRS